MKVKKLWYGFTAIFIGTLLVSYVLRYTPALLGSIYLLVSMVAFFLYAKDKSAAKKGRWRVPESTLQISALCGGWPGAVLGQQLLRHKTQKQTFRWGFYGVVAANIVLVIVLHNPKVINAYKPLFQQWQTAVTNRFPESAVWLNRFVGFRR